MSHVIHLSTAMSVYFFFPLHSELIFISFNLWKTSRVDKARLLQFLQSLEPVMFVNKSGLYIYIIKSYICDINFTRGFTRRMLRWFLEKV